MKKLPKKFLDRLQKSLKPYQEVAASIKARDVSEADTVTVVKDILADVFGYNKYSELTSEHAIRGTFCDLAIKIEGKIHFLIEVKSAGIGLNDSHIRQAVNYGAHQGIEWVALTNSIEWRIYKIEFSQPINFEEVARFNFTDLNHKKDDDIQKIFLLAREGLSLNAIQEYHQTAQIFNKYTVAQFILSDSVLSSLKKEMRKIFPDIKVDETQLHDLLLNDMLKREVLEGDKVKDAQQRIKRTSSKIEKMKQKALPIAADAKNSSACSVEETSPKLIQAAS